MTRSLEVRAAGAQMLVQDEGRRGAMAFGVARGGAADPLALTEAAALLSHDAPMAAIEMAASGGTFAAHGDLRIALTGAPMEARIAGRPVAWNASHALADGQELRIGGALTGLFGYLSVGGGIDSAVTLGSRSVQPGVGLGAALAQGDTLAIGEDPGGSVNRYLTVADRFQGGCIRVLDGPQTPLFDAATQERFAATAFHRDPRGNRHGIALSHDGDSFAADGQLTLLSDIIVPGDIQITGDGAPFVLMPDCQTTGGYPRIGTVVPDDLARVAQAPPGAAFYFEWIDRHAALEGYRAARADAARLPEALRPLVRDPADIDDLLGYQLISGVTDGTVELEDAP